MVPAETETFLKVFFFLENKGKEIIPTFLGKHSRRLYNFMEFTHSNILYFASCSETVMYLIVLLPLYDSAAFIRII